MLPAPGADSSGRVGTKRVLGQQREFVVRTDFPKPVGGGFSVVAEFLFALPQCFLAALALDELTDLAADASQHVEQLSIRPPDLAAEKLDDAQDFPPEQDGKPEGRA